MTRSLPLLVALAWCVLAPSLFAESEGNDKRRLDVYGDPLPDGATMRLGTTRFRVGGLVYACAFSPDGKTIAASSTHFTIRLFDAATGRRTKELLGHKYDATCLAYSLDGRLLASASIDGGICLHDAASGNLIRRFGRDTERLRCLAFLPDGKTLATGGLSDDRKIKDHPVRIWDIGTGNEIRVISGQSEDTLALAVSPDGKLLAVAGGSVNRNGVIRIRETTTGKLLYALQDRKEAIRSLSFSPDGKRLVSSGGNRLCFWDLDTKKITFSITDSDVHIQAAAFSPDGKLLAMGDNGCGFCVVEAATGRKIHRSEGRACVQTGNWHPGGVTCLAFSPDGRTLVYGADEALKIVDCTSWKERHPSVAHDAAVHRIHFADSKTLTTLADDGRLLRWDLGAAKATALLAKKPRIHSVYQTALSPDQKNLAAWSGPNIHLWDTASGEEVRALSVSEKGRPRCRIGRVVYSPDGKRLALTIPDRGLLCVWDTASGKELARLEKYPDLPNSFGLDPRCLLFAPDSRTIASPSSDGRTILLHDATSGKFLRELRAGKSRDLRCLAFSSDGRMLAAGVYRDGPICVWELRTGGIRLRLGGHDITINGLAFSRNNRWLASTSLDGTVRLWDAFSGELIHNWRCRDNDTACVAFSPDDRLLAASGSDTTVLLWDIHCLLTHYANGHEKLAASPREALWSDLSQQDAARAYRAMGHLVRSSEGVAFLRERLKPARSADDAASVRLILDLDSDRFAVREKAEADLLKMGETIESCLRRALANRPTLEMRRRIEWLLDKLQGPRLRVVRAVEVLERIGNPEARALLAELAKGGSEAEPTIEAKAALKRLRRHTHLLKESSIGANR
jgi:WD40 repeat protein